MNKTIVELIAASNFLADATQVERLASSVVSGQQADGTYLRVVLAHMKNALGKSRRRKDAQAHETVLNSIHDDLYPAVLKGVGDEDVGVVERNRRATFARSAASTVRYFIRNGGDVRSVDVSTASKNGLRKAVEPQSTAPEDESRMERGFRKAQEALVRSAQRLLARGDLDREEQRVWEALAESIAANT